MGAVAPIGKEKIAAARRAQVQALDPRRVNAGFDELIAVRGSQIQVLPVPAAPNETFCPRRPEGLLDVGTDFIAARADGRSKRDQKVVRPRSCGDQRSRGGLRDPRHRPAPAGMSGGHTSRQGVHDENWKAVRSFDREERAFRLGDARIRFRRIFERGLGHGAAVDLLQEEHRTLAAEGFPRCLLRLRSRARSSCK